MSGDLDLVYHGFGSGPSSSAMVLLERDGEVIGELRHWVKHSPTGFAWGYEGSGPAELARCLLLDAVGEEGRKCPSCAGSSLVHVLPDGSTRPAPDAVLPPQAEDDASDVARCFECDDGTVMLPYQSFKREVVARWPEEGFRIERWQILAWLSAHDFNPERKP